MAVTGIPTSGNDTLIGDGADDEIIGQAGNDLISGGGGDDTIFGDIRFLVNGQFESGQAPGTFSFGPIDGWSNTGSNGFMERWGDGFLGLSTADGGPFMELDVFGGGGVDHYQTNVDLANGLEYTLSFDHAARAGASVNDSFEVTLNGNVVATVTPLTTTSFATTEVTITGMAGGDVLGFREIAGQSNGLGPLLDNIQITLTEEEVANSGLDFNDTIDGGAGNDQIYGQEGDDVITGGAGDDFLDGGNGDNIFVLADGSGSDTIDGFTIGNDLLDVSGLTDAGGDSINAFDVVVASDGEGGSVLTFPNGEQVRIRDIPPDQLDTPQELAAIGIPCFVAGTMILTTKGEVRAEELNAGDEVIVLRDGQRLSNTLLKCFNRKLSARNLKDAPNLRPIRICAGALGENQPTRDLLVSPQHRMFLRSRIAKRMFGAAEVFVPAIALLSFPNVFRETAMDDVEYIHFLFNKHEVIFAEGAPTESLLVRAGALCSVGAEARSEIFQLFPELAIPGWRFPSSYPILEGPRRKRLIERHLKNGRPLIETAINNQY